MGGCDITGGKEGWQDVGCVGGDVKRRMNCSISPFPPLIMELGGAPDAWRHQARGGEIDSLAFVENDKGPSETGASLRPMT